ncbi:MAG: hypothetical protein AB1830_07715 [Pseudomonadota bacterium]
MIADYFAAEGPIVARLAAQVPGVAVLTSSDLAETEDAPPITPAIRVLYGGDRLGSQAGRGAVQSVFQRWLAVLVVRDTRPGGVGGGRQGAGQLLLQALSALSGWEPGPGFGPLKRVEAPAPHYGDGLAQFPLAFECQVITVVSVP